MTIDPYRRRQEWRSRGLGPGGRNLCFCGCGREVQPPRRTAFSDACVAAWRSINDPGHIRAIVFRRDRGICALCGLDTQTEQRIARETIALWRWLARRHFEAAFRRGELLQPDGSVARDGYEIHRAVDRATDEDARQRGWRPAGLHWWEADHIIPVAEGGGGCGPEGYRTLCCACHAGQTALLAGRLAARRRAKKHA